jgi:aspartate/methionine/tyrosine aminotransferase
MARRLQGFDAPTVWHEITPMAVKYNSENLGQGFPDWESPDFVKEALCSAVKNNANQYCRSGGDLPLVQELSRHYSPLVGREIDPLTEVTISVGATGALFAIMQSILNPGDEVVALEPAFDIYPAQVQMAGGICKLVPLRLDKTTSVWNVDMTELEAAITPQTKILLINTPHNPTGKVFTREELEAVVEILNRHPHVTAVMDEVGHCYVIPFVIF